MTAKRQTKPVFLLILPILARKVVEPPDVVTTYRNGWGRKLCEIVPDVPELPVAIRQILSLARKSAMMYDELVGFPKRDRGTLLDISLRVAKISLV